MSRIISTREPIKNREVVHKKVNVTKWASTRALCYFCGTNYGIVTHHIVGASGRSDEPCNLVRVCGPCHRRIHGTEEPKICIAKVYLVKQAHDPHEFDPLRLDELRGRVVPLSGAF